MKIEQTYAQNVMPLDFQNYKSGQDADSFVKNSEGIRANNINITQMTKLEKNALPVSEQMIIDSIEKANKAVMGANTRFEFSIHDKTKQIVVKVFNTDTGDLIREIPSEKILDIVAGIWQASGLFVDEKR